MASYKTVTGKDGIKRISVCFDLPSADGQRQQKRLSGFKTKKDAEIAYALYVANYSPAVKSDKGSTFEAVYKRFFDFQSHRTKESSYSSQETIFELHINPYFSGRNVSEIKPTDILMWQSWLNARTNARGKYKNKVLSHLRGFFYYCIDIEKLIAENPCSKKLKFIVSEPQGEMPIYTPEEYLQFRSAIPKDNFQDVVMFDMFYYTGIRKGELLALQWTDLKDQFISISKTYSRKLSKKNRELGEHKWKITSPKRNNSNRKILLPEFLEKELIKLKISKDSSVKDYIFGNSSPGSEKHIDKARDKYVKLAKVKRIRIHDFRHSHVSYLISVNTDIMTIASRIGDTVETLLETYAHLLPNKQYEMISYLDSISPAEIAILND